MREGSYRLKSKTKMARCGMAGLSTEMTEDRPNHIMRQLAQTSHKDMVLKNDKQKSDD